MYSKINTNNFLKQPACPVEVAKIGSKEEVHVRPVCSPAMVRPGTGIAEQSAPTMALGRASLSKLTGLSSLVCGCLLEGLVASLKGFVGMVGQDRGFFF